MADFILSEESAAEQLELFMDYYDVDMNDIPTAQRDAVDIACRKVSKAIRRGKIEIRNTDGLQVVQMVKETELVYGELTGRAKIAMGDKTDYGKIYALLGSLSGAGETAIQKLKGADLSIAECIGMLFLQV